MHRDDQEPRLLPAAKFALTVALHVADDGRIDRGSWPYWPRRCGDLTDVA